MRRSCVGQRSVLQDTTSLATAVSLNLLSNVIIVPGHTRSLRWLRRSIWSSGARPFPSLSFGKNPWARNFNFSRYHQHTRVKNKRNRVIQ
jgi:hypothetical protein